MPWWQWLILAVGFALVAAARWSAAQYDESESDGGFDDGDDGKGVGGHGRTDTRFVFDPNSPLPHPDERPTIYLSGRPVMLWTETHGWLNIDPGEPPKGPPFLEAHREPRV